jgi:hypothetical protein
MMPTTLISRRATCKLHGDGFKARIQQTIINNHHGHHGVVTVMVMVTVTKMIAATATVSFMISLFLTM